MCGKFGSPVATRNCTTTDDFPLVPVGVSPPMNHLQKTSKGLHAVRTASELPASSCFFLLCRNSLSMAAAVQQKCVSRSAAVEIPRQRSLSSRNLPQLAFSSSSSPCCSPTMALVLGAAPPTAAHELSNWSMHRNAGTALRAMSVDVPASKETSAVPGALQESVIRQPKEPERDFSGTEYIPIYVMLPLNTVNASGELSYPEKLKKDLEALKAVDVDGVMVDCWWGLVEGKNPLQYDWSGYRRLFHMVEAVGLKLQVVMSFHECGGNIGDDVHIALPEWVVEIGKENPDIFFTDGQGRANSECLTFGVDKERVLRGRTGVEVYYDYMKSFRQEFDDFFISGTITEIEVGLGACGELRYPSYSQKNGWKYPGIGQFQCYDKYMMKMLKSAAESKGHPEWGRGPDNAGEYNSRPQDTEFFRDKGDYDSYYGRFFLTWYSKMLIEHGDRVLSLAKLAFDEVKVAAKVSGIHWWYKTQSHAAELAAGFYNSSHRDGYVPIAQMLAKHKATFNFTCVELSTKTVEELGPAALADPEALVWQVLNDGWDLEIEVASENALPCYDRDAYNQILECAKPRKDPDGRHLSAFTYLRLSPDLMQGNNVKEFARFVQRLHGSPLVL